MARAASRGPTSEPLRPSRPARAVRPRGARRASSLGHIVMNDEGHAGHVEPSAATSVATSLIVVLFEGVESFKTLALLQCRMQGAPAGSAISGARKPRS